MNYQAFTNDSLTMMYAAVRGALAADDAAERQGGEPFNSRLSVRVPKRIGRVSRRKITQRPGRPTRPLPPETRPDY
jgi:hypothetical protein